MSYCIEYNPELKKFYPTKNRTKRLMPLKFLISICLVVAAYLLASTGVHRHLIPGDPTATTAAFSVLVEEIGEGEGLKDAVVAFCREVIINAR